MPKTKLNLSLDQDLADFAKAFAAENRTSVAEVINQYLLNLKRQVSGESVTEILAHPAFLRALEETRTKLRKGKVEWQSFEEVFDS